MGIKENFKQAAQELMHTPATEEQKEIKPVAADDAPKDAKTERVEKAPAERNLDFFTPIPKPVQRQRTVIAKGDSITGDLMCMGDLELNGTLVGNITGSGSLKLCGTLNGDAQGQTIEVGSGNIKGNLTAAGRVEVDSESTVLGDIHAESLDLNGKVRGNLEIKDMLTMSEKAAVLGKITTGCVSVATGALFQGELSIPAVDFNSLF